MYYAQGRIMSHGIEDYMATELLSFGPDDDIVAAMRQLLERHFSGAPVLDSERRLIGLLSQKDCLEIVYNTAYHQDWGGRVEQYMSREIETIDADCSVLEAAEKLQASKFRRFPVMRDGRLVGQISRHDVMRALDEIYLQKTP